MDTAPRDKPSDNERTLRVEELLRRLTSLPTLPAVATRLLAISADEASDSREVVRLIESDPSMSVAIVRLLGQMDRTARSRPASIERAVLSLGFRAVRDAALAVGVLSTLPIPPNAEAGGLDFEGFWTHGVAVAVATERLAAACPQAKVTPADAFLPGLLHDVGKLALQVAIPEAYVRVAQAARRHGLPIADAELRVLGLDHQTAGRRLAMQWDLPTQLVDCIWLHGTSPLAMPDGPNTPLVQLVTAADALVRIRHLGNSGSHGIPLPPTATLDALGISPAEADEALLGLGEDVAARVDGLGISDQSKGNGDPLRLYAAAVGAAHAELLSVNHRLREAHEAGSARKRTLETLDAFFEASSVAQASGVEAVAEAVAESARSGLGATRSLVLVPLEEAETPDGNGTSPVATKWSLVEANGSAARRVDPGDGAWPPSPGRLALLLNDARLADLRPLPIGEPGGAPANSGDAVVALLLCEGSEASRPSSTLSAAWCSALVAAFGRERASRALEQLAVANRRLDATRAAMAGREADARLREIAAGAAHEMNNPLAVIAGRTEQLAQRLDGENLPMVKAANAAAERLAELVAALGMFARPPVARRRPADVARIASDAVEAVRASGPLRREQLEPLEVTLRPAEGLSQVEVDADMLRKTLDELVTNALQARPARHVTVRLFKEAADAAPSPAMLVIEVSDDGTGLDERALQHAADPFFSLHPAGRRAGLGLSRVSMWAAAHGGSLRLRPSASGGCTAQVRLALP